MNCFLCTSNAPQHRVRLFHASPGADLHFHHFAVRTNHGCVNGLVTIFLRNWNIIFKPFRNWFINFRNDAVRYKAFTVVFVSMMIRTAKDRKFLLKLIALQHLIINAENMLRPACNSKFNFSSTSRFLIGWINRLINVRARGAWNAAAVLFFRIPEHANA